MNRYTIYCTEEQTRKAFELGAPKLTVCPNYQGSIITGTMMIGNDLMYIPTAEQMTEWLLQEHDILCDVFPLDGCFDSTWFAFRIAKRDGKWIKFESNVKDYSTRKEATLAAIDAALEYLSQTKVSPN